MPIYEFQDMETGEVVGVEFERMEGPEGPPGLGGVIEADGRRLKRILSLPQAPIVENISFTAWSQRPGSPGAKHYDGKGFPRFESKQEVRDYVAVTNNTVDKKQGGEFIEYE